MRGYQKRVIYLKNTGSHLFEEAYFVVKSEQTAVLHTMPDMVKEANRIISENIKIKKRVLKWRTGYFISFMSGALISFVLTLILI